MGGGQAGLPEGARELQGLGVPTSDIFMLQMLFSDLGVASSCRRLDADTPRWTAGMGQIDVVLRRT